MPATSICDFEALSITGQPANQSVGQGVTATFSVTSTVGPACSTPGCSSVLPGQSPPTALMC